MIETGKSDKLFSGLELIKMATYKPTPNLFVGFDMKSQTNGPQAMDGR